MAKKLSKIFTTFLTVAALILHLYGPWALIATEAHGSNSQPPNPNWPTNWTTPSDCSTDPQGDQNPSNIDLVGDSSDQAVGYAVDGNYYMYFKEKLKGDPGGAGGFAQQAWVVLFQKTAPGYQYLVSLNGKDDKVEVWQNSPEAGPVDFHPLLNDPAETVIWQGDASFYAKIDHVAGKFYLYWAVPLSVLNNVGITTSTTKFFATSSDANNFNKDYLDCYESPAPVCGNNQIEPPEICDGNSTSCTTQEGYAGFKLCNQTCNGWQDCQATEYCGDGIKNGQEQCDDGNTQNGDGCSAFCQIETCPNLFFSEYIEGSSNNKAVEIYNPTNRSINLSNYTISLYMNGAHTPSTNISLSGTVNSHDVFIVCNSSASQAIKNKCDLQKSNLDFNGDDAIALKDSSVIIDTIGRIGEDPGDEWGSDLTSTKDNTLVRKCGISCGDPNGSDVFNPAVEWNGYAKDTFDYLGFHQEDCCVCGDGEVNQPSEECDGDEPKICLADDGYLGYQSCGEDCLWGPCVSFQSCGDGEKNGPEECDTGENNGKVCEPEYGSSCQYCSESCSLETIQGDYCGDGVKNGEEECDGTDGVTEGQNFCTVNCKLVPIYDGENQCPFGTRKSQNPVVTKLIHSEDPDGEIFSLTAGGKYLFEVSGTFIPTSAPGYVSDAGYTTINGVLSSQYGIHGTGNDYAAHALLADLGSGVGVVNWGNYNFYHVYTKYYEPTTSNVQFVIGDRYGDWFNTPWQNQTGMNDNDGSLTLNVYECQELGSLYIRKNVLPHYAWNEGPEWNFDILGTDLDSGGWTLGDQHWGGMDLPPGEYGVKETPGPGVNSNYQTTFRCLDNPSFRDQTWTGTEIASGAGTETPSLNLQPGHTVFCEFTNTELGSISGYKFEDINGNGKWEEGELPLEGWQICLSKVNDEGGYEFYLARPPIDIEPSEENCTYTNSEGYYEFTGLLAGAYIVSEETRDGWRPTTPSFISLEIVSGQEYTNQNFGNVGLPVFKVTKTNSVPTFINPNMGVTYTITITNSGLGPAFDFEVKDILPAGFNYVTGTSVITGATGTGPVINGNTLSWLIDRLDAGKSMTISYQVLVLPSVLAGTYTNTVTVEDATAGSSVEVRIPMVAGEMIEKEGESVVTTTNANANSNITNPETKGKVLGESISTGGSLWQYLLVSLLISFGVYLWYLRASLNKKRFEEEKN